MREIRPSSSEGGVAGVITGHPYPYSNVQNTIYRSPKNIRKINGFARTCNITYTTVSGNSCERRGLGLPPRTKHRISRSPCARRRSTSVVPRKPAEPETMRFQRSGLMRFQALRPDGSYFAPMGPPRG
jgi:hypothetical protein